MVMGVRYRSEFLKHARLDSNPDLGLTNRNYGVASRQSPMPSTSPHAWVLNVKSIPALDAETHLDPYGRTDPGFATLLV